MVAVCVGGVVWWCAVCVVFGCVGGVCLGLFLCCLVYTWALLEFAKKAFCSMLACLVCFLSILIVEYTSMQVCCEKVKKKFDGAGCRVVGGPYWNIRERKRKRVLFPALCYCSTGRS